MARANTRYQISLRVNIDEIRVFAQILQKADPIMYKFLTTRLREAGKLVQAEAKNNAAFSTRIPEAILTRMTVGSVSVYVDGNIAPEAKPLEHGGLEGTFRHLVYGRPKSWVSQKAQPFLTPALAARHDEVVGLILTAVEETMAEIARAK